MKIKIHHVLAACGVLLSGCSTARLVPPANVPVQTQGPSEAASGWRPYSSGPLQAASPGISTGSRNWTSPRREPVVVRKPLPAIAEPPVERADVAEKKRQPDDGSGQWETYKGGRSDRIQPSAGSSVFGRGINSSWAKEYVPSSHHTEFGIFAAKAAKDGQARMVMPTGEVYSASVVRRNGPCTSLEVGVTADGDLPLIARGSVEVCR